MSKFKVGDEVIHDGEIKVIEKIEYFKDGKTLGYVLEGNSNGLLIDVIVMENSLELYKSPHQELLDLGFEKVAKHKYVKVNKGGSGYNTPYKITIEFAFNMYQVKCECENWVGVDLQLAKILVRYLEELEC